MPEKKIIPTPKEQKELDELNALGSQKIIPTPQDQKELDELNGSAQAPVESTPQQQATPQPSSVSPPAKNLTELTGIPVPVDQFPLQPKVDPEVARKQEVLNRARGAQDAFAHAMLQNSEAHHPNDVSLLSAPVADPSHPLMAATNLQGNPEVTGTAFLNLKNKIEADKRAALDEYDPRDPEVAKTGAKIEDIAKPYDQKIADLQNQAGTIIAHQIFNKENSRQSHTITQEQADIAINSIDKAEKKRVAEIDAQLNSSARGAMTGLDVDRLTAERNRIQADADHERTKIQVQAPWDDTRIGIEYKAALGDKQAMADKARIEQGLPISPALKYQYDIEGGKVKAEGHTLAEASGLQQTAVNAAPHLQTPEKLESQNQTFLTQKRAKEIGDYLYQNKNPFHTALNWVVPETAPGEEEIKKAGKELGYTDAQIKNIKPDDIPTQATLEGQFTKGLVNSAASTYDVLGRNTIGRVLPTGQWRENHQPGWENERGLGSVFAANAPESQSKGVTGLLGHAFEGAGGLAGFVAEAGLLGKGITALNLGTDVAAGSEAALKLAEKTEHYAVNTKMFLDGYNSAYNNSFDVVGKGDSTQDEAKRQAYAMLNGLATTAIFAISPKTKIINNILGEDKAGINEIVNRITSEGVKAFEDPTVKEKIIKGISESIKEDGKQIGLATAAQVFTNLENIVASKDNKYKIGDNLSETAMSTAVAMSLPSIFSGVAQGARLSPINRDLVVEIGADPNKYIDAVNRLKDDGKISEADLQKSLSVIGKMQEAVRNAPGEHPANGRLFTDTQQKDYAVLELKRKILSEKKDNLESRNASDVEVGEVNTAIKDVEKEQKSIMDKVAKAPDLILPEPKETEEPEATAPGEKIPEEKVAQPKEEPVTLESDKQTTKTETHEESSTKANAEKESDAEKISVPEKGRTNEEGQGLHVEPTEEKGKEGAGEEAVHPSEVNNEPETKTEPLQEAPPAKKSLKERLRELEKTVEDATPQSKEQQQEIGTKGSKPEHAPIEQARREAPQPKAEGGDSDKRSQEEKIADLHQKYDAVGPRAKSYQRDKLGEKIHQLREQIKDIDPKSKEYRDAFNELEATKKFLHKVTPTGKKGKVGLPEHIANRKELEKSNPDTFEEEVLHHLLNGGKFETKSIEQHLTTKKGSEENNNAHKWLSEEKGKNVANADQFGAESEFAKKDVGETGHHGAIGEILSNYKDKFEVAKRLVELHRERVRAEKENIEGQPEHEINLPSGETVKLDPTHPDYHNHLAELYGYKGELDHIDDPEHPLYKPIEEAVNALHESKLEDTDYEAISKLIDEHTDDNGELDKDKFADALLELKNISPGARELVDKILPFNTTEENASHINNLTEEIKKYENRNSKGPVAENTDEGQGKGGTDGNGLSPHREDVTSEGARETRLQKRLKRAGDRIVELAEENAKKSEGLVGAFPGLSPKVASDVLILLAKAVRQGLIHYGNLDAALRRAIVDMKYYYRDAPGISDEDRDAIESISVKTLKESGYFNEEIEPSFSGKNKADKKEIADEYIAEIKNGSMTKEEVLNEIKNENISPKAKAEYVDYIDWNTGGREELNDRQEEKQAASEAKNPFSELDLENSHEVSQYLGAHTTKDIVGESGYMDSQNEEKEKIKINLLTRNAHDYVNIYKIPDIKVSDWGAKMMSDIKSDASNPMKQVVALSGLHGELQTERRAQESKLDELSKKISANAPGENIETLKKERATTLAEYNKTKALIGEVQNVKKKILSSASGTLNAGRVDRLVDGNILFEQFENTILSKKEKQGKTKAEEVLNAPVEKLAPKERNVEDEAAASKERKKKEETAKAKTKNVLKRAKDYIKDKAAKKKISEIKNEAIDKFGRNSKGEKMTGSEFLEHLKKLKNPC